jgi:hypothetical protein
MKILLGFVSVRRSTLRIYSHTGGRAGLGAPHVKPSVRPPILSQNTAFLPGATKLYSAGACLTPCTRHIGICGACKRVSGP